MAKSHTDVRVIFPGNIPTRSYEWASVPEIGDHLWFDTHLESKGYWKVAERCRFVSDDTTSYICLYVQKVKYPPSIILNADHT